MMLGGLHNGGRVALVQDHLGCEWHTSQGHLPNCHRRLHLPRMVQQVAVEHCQRVRGKAWNAELEVALEQARGLVLGKQSSR